MNRLILLALVLFAFWLAMSGSLKPWLVVSGAVASALVVAFSVSKRVVDAESFPFEWLPRAFGYWLWLLRQIVQSALAVTRIILAPSLPISPRMVRVAARQTTATGLVTYANSITLTPGTISVEVGEQSRTIWVHAITRENADGFADDEMNARVARLDGSEGSPA